MVVQSLRHELQGQPVLVAGGLFNLGPLILEPDFNLGLVQAEFLGQRLSPLLRYVPVGLELVFQSLQLLGRERCPGPLVLLGALLLFQFPCPWAWRGNNNGNKKFISTARSRAQWTHTRAHTPPTTRVSCLGPVSVCGTSQPDTVPKPAFSHNRPPAKRQRAVDRLHSSLLLAAHSHVCKETATTDQQTHTNWTITGN